MKMLALIAFFLGIAAAQIFGGSLFAASGKTFEYMVVPNRGNIETVQNSLETQAAKGWRLHTFANGVLIFEK